MVTWFEKLVSLTKLISCAKRNAREQAWGNSLNNYNICTIFSDIKKKQSPDSGSKLTVIVGQR